MEEKVKFEDSNIALLGSEFEKKIREERAEGEPQWKTIKEVPGLQIWRIEKFNVVPWPQEQYSYFYKGDTYIVLNIKKKDNADGLDYFAHMWVGMETSVDEAGTGAYKIVELDDYLKGAATLVYEPQDAESTLFMSYFKTITIMEGGIESGFKKVPITEYKPRLLHVRGVGKSIHSSEVPLAFSSLNSEDVFILDAGTKLFNWRGKTANSYEKFHGASLCEKIKGERSGKASVVHLDQDDKNEEFLSYFKQGNDAEIKEKKDAVVKQEGKKMMKLSDETGKLTLEPVAYSKQSLDTNDTFLIDRGDLIFIWVGNGASKNEKRYALAFGQKYLAQENRTTHVSMITVVEGQMQNEIDKCFI